MIQQADLPKDNVPSRDDGPRAAIVRAIDLAETVFAAGRLFRAEIENDRGATRAEAEAILTEIRRSVTGSDGKFRVRQAESHAAGPNPALQEDLRSFGAAARRIASIADSNGGNFDPRRDLELLLETFDVYECYLRDNFTLTTETSRVIAESRAVILGTMPEEASAALNERRFNRYAYKVDDALDLRDDEKERIAESELRKAQPASVWIDNASGVNLAQEGVILTNAHVAREKDRRMTVKFPDGRSFSGVCTSIDHTRDLAIVKLEDVKEALPYAKLEDEKPPAGTQVVNIGQPYGYDAWHVSTGQIKEYKPDHPTPDGLGGLVHTAWTYWGNSGSPIFDLDGDIVGLHNTWDSRTALRHAVPLDEIVAFLEANGARFEKDTD